MKFFYYPILKKSFWHCLKCLSASADIYYTTEKTKVIEITTTENEGFREMSSICLEVSKLIEKCSSIYNISYKFK